MAPKGKKKGHELEKAVGFIQETILKTDPKLAGTEFSIEMNKIANVLGVRHEIDVYVKTLPDSQFESAWIFECKDWKKPVGKNEVIILARKVDVMKANRGFLVARRFTKDAKAQVLQDSRLSLVPCTDEFPTLFNVELTHTKHDLWPITISVRERGTPQTMTPVELDWEKLVCRMNGQLIDFRSYIGRNIDLCVAEDQQENAAKYRYESTHFGYRGLRIDFRAGELILNDMDVEFIFIPVQFWVTVQSRKVISKFELKGQGRYFSFEPIDDPASGRRIKIGIVQRI
jgi:hypothetical protein